MRFCGRNPLVMRNLAYCGSPHRRGRIIEGQLGSRQCPYSEPQTPVGLAADRMIPVIGAPGPRWRRCAGSEFVMRGVAQNDSFERPSGAQRLWQRRTLLSVAVAFLLVVMLPTSASPVPVTLTPRFTQVSGACALLAGGDAVCWGGAGINPKVAGPFVSLSAGGQACATRPDRSIACWDPSSGGDLRAIAGSFSSVSVGDAHECALRTDGDITCWGDNSFGQAPPRITGPFRSVSAGWRRTCAVTADGDARCWGSNDYGQAAAKVVGPFTALSADWAYTWSLGPDGELKCWGGEPSLPKPARLPGLPSSAPATVGM